MARGMFGAVTDELRDVATRFAIGAETVHDAGALASKAVRDLEWVGEDADRFRTRFETELMPDLGHLSNRVDDLAVFLRQQADQQDDTSSSRRGVSFFRPTPSIDGVVPRSIASPLMLPVIGVAAPGTGRDDAQGSWLGDAHGDRAPLPPDVLRRLLEQLPPFGLVPPPFAVLPIAELVPWPMEPPATDPPNNRTFPWWLPAIALPAIALAALALLPFLLMIANRLRPPSNRLPLPWDRGGDAVPPRDLLPQAWPPEVRSDASGGGPGGGSGSGDGAGSGGGGAGSGGGGADASGGGADASSGGEAEPRVFSMGSPVGVLDLAAVGDVPESMTMPVTEREAPSGGGGVDRPESDDGFGGSGGVIASGYAATGARGDDRD